MSHCDKTICAVIRGLDKNRVSSVGGEQKSLNPIHYIADIDVRFGDLDPYGHVNSAAYLDYVFSSRLIFAKRNLQFDCIELMQREGLGFFVSQANVRYLRPIIGMTKISVNSWTQKISRLSLEIEFCIRDSNSGLAHAGGQVFVVVMNLKSNKPCSLPVWAERYFFERRTP